MLRLRPARPDDVPAIARICLDAFGALQDRHAVERDFDSLDTTTMVMSMLCARPDFVGVVAEQDGRPVGSNFLQVSDATPHGGVAGVGPITVDPAAQSRGVGRALMLAVMDAAKERGLARVRLMQEAINTTSLCLYTKLGFDWRECCLLMRAPALPATPDPRVRPLTDADLPALDAISRRYYHHSRVNECAAALNGPFGGVGLADAPGGPLVGYHFPGFFGHGFAPDAERLALLTAHSGAALPPRMRKCIVPLGEHALHRALLDRGARAVKMFNSMTTGEYTRPTGAWIPSIGF